MYVVSVSGVIGSFMCVSCVLCDTFGAEMCTYICGIVFIRCCLI